LTFFGGYLEPIPEYDPEGLDPKHCFFIYDSTGEVKPCKDVELFKQVLTFKKSLNWQIKQWVEGYDWCLMGVDEYISMLKDPPEWVYKAFRNQLKQRWRKQCLK